MLKIETLTELEIETNFDTMYEIISMQAIVLSTKYTPKDFERKETYLEKIEKRFTSTFQSDNSKFILDLYFELLSYETQETLSILGRPTMHTILKNFYKNRKLL